MPYESVTLLRRDKDEEPTFVSYIVGNDEALRKFAMSSTSKISKKLYRATNCSSESSRNFSKANYHPMLFPPSLFRSQECR